MLFKGLNKLKSGSTSHALSHLALFAALVISNTAAAQSIVPPTADPGRVRNDIQGSVPSIPAPDPQALASPPEVKAPPGAEEVRFVLNKIVISGASSLSQAEIAAVYKPLIGKEISLPQLYDIANNITRLYNDKGYILTRAVIPQQEIRNGAVRIEVIEGYVSSFDIQGEIGPRTQIESYAKELIESGPLTAKTLERYLLLMNDLPGAMVRSVLSPSKKADGSAHISLIAEQDRFQGFAGIDNFGNSFLGPERLTLGGQFNGLFRSSDQVNGLVLWAPDHDELKYYSLGFHHNIGNQGTKIGVSVSQGITNPSLPLSLGGFLEPDGEALFLGFDVDHPFIRSRNLNLYGGLNFEISRNKTDYIPGFSAIETKDSQRVLRAQARISYLDSLQGYNSGNVVLSKGFEILGSSEKGDANLSRPEGDPSFTKINLGASRLQHITGPFNVLVAATGQYSPHNLLSSEEFGFGGTEFGRGYDSSQITGEYGMAGKIEISYNDTMQEKYPNDYQLYTFYDAGKVWNTDAAVGQGGNESAASVGVGTRIGFTSSLRGDAFIAKPLTEDITSRGDNSRDLRFKFSLNATF